VDKKVEPVSPERPRRTIEFVPQEERPAQIPWAPEPSILTQPNIPKPLHNVNPRSILGDAWWETQKDQAKRRTGNRCGACGAGPRQSELKGLPRLECHEVYDFDYKRGRVTFQKVVPLCHYCHNFIHSGRLTMIAGKEKSWAEVKAILEHGFSVLAEANKARPAGAKCFQAFPVATSLAIDADAKKFNIRPAPMPETEVPWENWRMIILGQEHPPFFKTYQEWFRHWKR
jgi:hypothetical protein